MTARVLDRQLQGGKIRATYVTDGSNSGAADQFALAS